MPTLWRCTTSSTQTSRSHWSSSTWWDQQNLCPHVLHDSSVVLCTDAKMKCILHYDYSWASAEPRRIIQEQLLQVVCLWCACSLSTLLTIPPPPFSLSHLGQRPQAVHGRLREHPEHAECQGEPLQAACWPGQLHQLSQLCGWLYQH